MIPPEGNAYEKCHGSTRATLHCTCFVRHMNGSQLGCWLSLGWSRYLRHMKAQSGMKSLRMKPVMKSPRSMVWYGEENANYRSTSSFFNGWYCENSVAVKHTYNFVQFSTKLQIWLLARVGQWYNHQSWEPVIRIIILAEKLYLINFRVRKVMPPSQIPSVSFISPSGTPGALITYLIQSLL